MYASNYRVTAYGTGNTRQTTVTSDDPRIDPKCDSPAQYSGNAQASLLERVADWINGIDYQTKNTLVKWLYTSSKARNLAPSATIFAGERQDVGRYAVQTLAYELAIRLPQQFCEQLLHTVEHDPRLFSRSLEVQVNKLILEPLGSLS